MEAMDTLSQDVTARKDARSVVAGPRQRLMRHLVRSHQAEAVEMEEEAVAMEEAVEAVAVEQEELALDPVAALDLAVDADAPITELSDHTRIPPTRPIPAMEILMAHQPKAVPLPWK